MQDWLSYLWYEAAFWSCTAGLTLGYSLRTEGMRNLPARGPALLLANHVSYLDPVMIALAARRHLCFLARKGLFNNPAFGWLIRSFNAAPIDQDGFAREGLRTILEHLHQDKAVLVFPEGERSPHGGLQPLRPGIHLLIKRVDMPIIPVGIAGAYEAWPRWQRLPTLAPLFLPAGKGTLAVSIGEPIPSSKLKTLPREEVLEYLFKKLLEVRGRADKLRRKPQ